MGGSGNRYAAMAAVAAVALLLWPTFASVDAAPQAEASQMPIRDVSYRPPLRPVIAPLAGPEQPQLQLTASIGEGDSFAHMLQRAGIGRPDAERAAALVAAETPLKGISGGTRVALTLGRRASATEPRPLERLAFRPRLDLALTLERRGGALTVVRQPIAITETPLRIRGIVGASLYRSARAAGVPASAAQQYLRVLDRHLLLERDVLPSDEFDMVVVNRRAATGESEGRQKILARKGCEDNVRIRRFQCPTHCAF